MTLKNLLNFRPSFQLTNIRSLNNLYIYIYIYIYITETSETLTIFHINFFYLYFLFSNSLVTRLTTSLLGFIKN